MLLAVDARGNRRTGPSPGQVIAALGALSPRSLRSMLDTIGATPLSPLWMRTQGRRRRVGLKLEGHNLTGSIKDRTALSLVRGLLARGRLAPGSTIVESTSGNLGVALALICRALGHSFVAVVDPHATGENLAKMSALGAEVDMVGEPGHGSFLASRLARVAELRALTPALVWANQYGDEANPSAHRTSTAPEILRQMDRRLDAVFVAVSTCGTLVGVSSFLRRFSPRTRVIAVDAVGSTVFGGTAAPRLLVGIGSSRRPDFAIEGLYDDVVRVDDETAFSACRQLDERCGLRVGGSSGAVVAACHRYLADAPELERVVCICPDTGDNYTSTIWDDGWLHGNGLDLARASARLDFGFSLDPGHDSGRLHGPVHG
jgi:2,3-diaminopropionate biosynthesis protein SbnA